jgi:hypothetical protein
MVSSGCEVFAGLTEAGVVALAADVVVDVAFWDTGTTVETGMYQTLPFEDAEAVRLVGND